MQIPLAVRSQVTRLGDLPVPTNDGRTVPLSELGVFRKDYEDPVIYTIDLRGVEYVVGEMEGRLGAPIYGMLNIDDMVKEYTTPDGVKMPTMPITLLELLKDDSTSHFEWTGEWTVTYETFRDMGGAFMAALILIYGLIVWEFKNFALAGIIMSPIPVTLMGIIPGHWLFGAEFTATSMIGMIALGGIIVRQSILIVEFVKIEVAQGSDVAEAAVKGAEMRMRPIFITSLTLMAGAFAILQDPIFNGMAISLLFGAGVATVMAVIIVPLGCISARKQFYVETADDGTVSVSRAFQLIEHPDEAETAKPASGTPLLMRLWGGIISAISWVFIIIKAVFTLIGMGFKGIFGRFGRGRGGTPPPPRGGTPPPRQPPPGGTPPPPRETPAPAGGTPPPPRETAPPLGEPVTARGGTPPPPRETPPPREAPAPAGGTPPPPREAPPLGEPVTARGGTPPPPRETPPPREVPAPAGGTPPPPRETAPPLGEPVTARGGTPPPPREVPSAAVGTPPPPREAPAPAGGTPPPPTEAPAEMETPGTGAATAQSAIESAAPVTAAQAPVAEAPAPAAPASPAPPEAPAAEKKARDVTELEDESDQDFDIETHDSVGSKRRGIRLKQDLN
jgi:hypothetical protein